MTTRADRVVAGFEGAGIDALLVADAVNLRYLTGFTGSNGLAVVGADLRRFVTDFRYVEQAAAEVPDFDRERGPRDLLDALREPWPEGEVRLGFDDAHVSVRTHRRLRDLLPDRVELVPAAGLVERVRAVKEPGEVETLRAAARIADTIYRELAEEGLVGRTEREVAMTLEHRMRVLGADGPSFSSIVASGPRGALPHAQPQDVPIPRDTLVTLDLGAVLDGYASDCTRTWATGDDIPDALAEAYDLTLRAQVAALEAVRPGPTGAELDAIARDVVEAAGHGEHFGHPLGHGVGLDVHEDPRLSKVNGRPLEAGNVVTVEPGVYLPGVGGVRIEDLVVVTAEGHEV
ncbi:MAG: Aminopeptidase YpdF (MP-, MA-, MS-, AP-, NP-specific), partial [uncultured Solirubrobacteraceae bacterium]